MTPDFANTSHLQLDDGSEITLSKEDAQHVYEELWNASGVRGALSAAAKVAEAQHTSRDISRAHHVNLTRDESTIVQQLLHAQDKSHRSGR